MTITLKKIGIALMLALTCSSLAFAQNQPAPTSRPEIIPDAFTPGESLQERLLIPNSAGANAPQEQFFGGVFLPILTQAIIGLSGGFAFIFMIVGGIQILTAYGNEERVSAGKKSITYAIVGFLIAILSYSIVSIISGVNLGGSQQGQQQQEQSDTTTSN